MSERKIFYKYRAFNATTLSMLCRDKIYYAHPSSFNDPMDSRPYFESDSSNEDLRTLLTVLMEKRIEAEIQMHLHKAGVAADHAKECAKTHASKKVSASLGEITYQATNPFEEGTDEEKVNWYLKCAVGDELLKQLKGAFCTSTSYSNLLLWSHYGDQHKGICIGYSTNRNPVPVMKEVVYGNKCSIRTSVVCDAYLHNKEPAFAELEESLLLRKAEDWKYESEWRLFGTEGEQDSPLRLSEVIFGVRCEEAVKHAVVKALTGRESKVNYFEMYRINEFQLERSELDIEALERYLPSTAMSASERGFVGVPLPPHPL